MPWFRGLRVGRVALWWPKLCEPTVLPSVEKGLLGRGLWDKPLPAGETRHTGHLGLRRSRRRERKAESGARERPEEDPKPIQDQDRALEKRAQLLEACKKVESVTYHPVIIPLSRSAKAGGVAQSGEIGWAGTLSPASYNRCHAQNLGTASTSSREEIMSQTYGRETPANGRQEEQSKAGERKSSSTGRSSRPDGGG